MATASVEAARPFNLAMPQLMGAVFIDAGQAATSWGGYRPQIGWGAGLLAQPGGGRSKWTWRAPSRPGAGGCTLVSALRYEPARSHPAVGPASPLGSRLCSCWPPASACSPPRGFAAAAADAVAWGAGRGRVAPAGDFEADHLQLKLSTGEQIELRGLAWRQPALGVRRPQARPPQRAAIAVPPQPHPAPARRCRPGARRWPSRSPPSRSPRSTWPASNCKTCARPAPWGPPRLHPAAPALAAVCITRRRTGRGRRRA